MRDLVEETALPIPLSSAHDVSARADLVERLYRRHRTRVFQIALRYGGGDAGFAEDVLQDVFVSALQVLDRLEDTDALDGWFYRVTTNRCLSRLRKERFLERSPFRFFLRQGSEPPSAAAVTELHDDVRRVLARLGALSPKERVVLCMVHLDDKPQQEVAAILGLSKGYVSKLLARAEARLRDAEARS